jgi:hypothetical protein
MSAFLHHAGSQPSSGDLPPPTRAAGEARIEVNRERKTERENEVLVKVPSVLPLRGCGSLGHCDLPARLCQDTFKAVGDSRFGEVRGV